MKTQMEMVVVFASDTIETKEEAKEHLMEEGRFVSIEFVKEVGKDFYFLVAFAKEE